MKTNEHVHTAVLQTDDRQGPTAQHTDRCSMLRGSLDGRQVWGRMDACVCTAESLCSSSETITTLLIGYIPMLLLLFSSSSVSASLQPRGLQHTRPLYILYKIKQF